MPEERPTEASEYAGTPSAGQEKPLHESLDDATILLWFATREGKEVEDSVVRDIVKAQSELRGGGRNAAVEGRFWTAYRKLAKAVQPVSIESILANYGYLFGYDPSKTGTADAIATKKRYSRLAVVTLGFLILVQVYWFIGNTWRTDLEGNRAELDRIAGDLREMSFKLEVANFLAQLKDQQFTEIKDQQFAGLKDQQFAQLKDPPFVQYDVEQLDATVLNPDDDPLVTVEKQIAVLLEIRGRMDLDAKNAELRGKRIQEMLYANSRMLNFWDFVTDLVDWLKGENSDVRPRQPHDLPEEVKAGSGTTTASDADYNDPETLRAEASWFERQHLGVEDALVNSKSVLETVSQYFLPLLYGLLGAYAYILRRLSKEIRDLTFTRGSEIGYSLRWPLGVLGGVTVGLFFDPADFSGVAVITPLGLAFLAGYGVELLFTGLDRMVSAFTGEDAGRPRTA
jgi:hypothetical protein